MKPGKKITKERNGEKKFLVKIYYLHNIKTDVARQPSVTAELSLR